MQQDLPLTQVTLLAGVISVELVGTDRLKVIL